MSRHHLPVACALIAISGLANAALQGRDLDGNAANGFEAFYDTKLNITWLADANLYETQYAQATNKNAFIADIVAGTPNIAGHQVTGSTGGGDVVPYQLNWYGAMAWAQSLNVYGYADWRLPTLTPMDGGAALNTTYRFDGLSDTGYNITSPTSELAYMYYVNLGLKSDHDPLTGHSQGGYGVPRVGQYTPPIAVEGGGSIINFNVGNYWYGVESGPDSAWHIDNLYGYQSGTFSATKDWRYKAWAVRDGDVAAVPEPDAGWLALLGIGTILVAAKRQPRR